MLRPISLACAVMVALLTGCSNTASPEIHEQDGFVPSGHNPRLDLYRAVIQERTRRALAQPAPASDPARQALVWGLVGSILSIQDMGPLPSDLMEQALEGKNLDVLQRVPGTHDPQALVLAFIDADLVASDPHARYLPPLAVENLDRRLQLFDEGLGISVIEERPGTIVVSGISDGSPAAQVKRLDVGHELKRVQDKEGKWYSPQDQAQWQSALSGPVGSKAMLEWVDKAGKTHSSSMERTWWSIESQRARATIVDTPAGRLGLVSVPAFYDRGDEVGTLPDMVRSIEALRAGDADIMVLDLRGNRGGEWRTVIDSAQVLMPGGRLANALGPLDRPLPVDVPTHESAWVGPVWVWVDQHTASGGEILAGALRESVGACIVGERTFGKATMQERIDIKPPAGGQVLLSTVLYAWPSGKTAQWSGVEPDMWMSDPGSHDATGERAYPSALIPPSSDVSTDSPVHIHPTQDEASWVSASIQTPQCKRS